MSSPIRTSLSNVGTAILKRTGSRRGTMSRPLQSAAQLHKFSYKHLENSQHETENKEKKNLDNFAKEDWISQYTPDERKPIESEQYNSPTVEEVIKAPKINEIGSTDKITDKFRFSGSTKIVNADVAKRDEETSDDGYLTFTESILDAQVNMLEKSAAEMKEHQRVQRFMESERGYMGDLGRK